MIPQLDNPVELFRRTTKTSELGEPNVTSWEFFGHAWAEVKPASGALVIAAEREGAKAEYNITIRFRPGIVAAETKVGYNGRVFAVIQVTQPAGTRGQWLSLTVGELPK